MFWGFFSDNPFYTAIVTVIFNIYRSEYESKENLEGCPGRVRNELDCWIVIFAESVCVLKIQFCWYHDFQYINGSAAGIGWKF